MVLCRTVLLAVFACGSAAQATSVVEVTTEEMLWNSALVFEGQVIDVAVHEDSNGIIQTRVTFEIIDVIKGEARGRTISLEFLGGEVAGRKLSVSDLHMPELHERGIYFVESTGSRHVHPLYGWSQGHLMVEMDHTGTDRVFTRGGKPVKGIMHTNGRRTGKLSHGVARGMMLGTASSIKAAPEALDVREFKRLLREMQ